MDALEVEKFLWKSFIVGYVLLLISFLFVWLGQGFVMSIHMYFFPDLDPEEMSSLLYLLYGFMKILIVVIFLVPAVAMHWTRKSSKI